MPFDCVTQYIFGPNIWLKNSLMQSNLDIDLFTKALLNFIRGKKLKIALISRKMSISAFEIRKIQNTNVYNMEM